MRGGNKLKAAALAAVLGTSGLTATGVGAQISAPTLADDAAVWGDDIVAVADDGGALFTVTASGEVSAPEGRFEGDMTQFTLNGPIVGMEVDADGSGYWLIGQDGGVFAFDAPFLGSMGGQVLNQPVVDMAAHPDGDGYWFVASDGGIFAFGNAPFYGSMGSTPLNRPIVGMTATASGEGYWMVANDGGLFAFGDAAFYGSLGSNPPSSPVVGMALTPGGEGYWMFDASGAVYEFGDATAVGDAAGQLGSPVVGAVPIIVDGQATGFRMVLENGEVVEVTPETDFSGPPTTQPPTTEPPVAEPPAGSYAWLISQQNPDGNPIRWDGCTPIPYWTDLTLAPADARERVEAVVAVIEQASGYDLVYQGDTTMLSAEFRSSIDYGMLVRWSSEAQEPGLAGSAIGLGGPSATGTWTGDGWEYWIRTGVVQIDAGFTGFQEGWGNPNSLEEVLAHEFAHAMNLGHVDFTSELMYPAAIGIGGLGEGTSWALDHAQDLTCRNDSGFTAAGAPSPPPTYTVDIAVGLDGTDVGEHRHHDHDHGHLVGVLSEPRLYGSIDEQDEEAPVFGDPVDGDGDGDDPRDHDHSCGCCACGMTSSH
ncbi:MAG: hypothetical protein AAGA17_02850 [Actinomycetota bacterium]